MSGVSFFSNPIQWARESFEELQGHWQRHEIGVAVEEFHAQCAADINSQLDALAAAMKRESRPPTDYQFNRQKQVDDNCGSLSDVCYPSASKNDHVIKTLDGRVCTSLIDPNTKTAVAFRIADKNPAAPEKTVDYYGRPVHLEP